RMLQEDWNDALVTAWVPQFDVKESIDKGESVVNSAMAAYVFDYYARMLAYAGDGEHVIAPIRAMAEQHRAAVRGQWAGTWFRRVWRGAEFGWLGDACMWIEPQTRARISRITDEQQTKTQVKSMY